MAAQKTRARKALEAEAAALEAEIAALEAPKTFVLVTSYEMSRLDGYPRPPGVKESRRLADGSWETTFYLRVPAFEEARWRREHEAFKAAQWGYAERAVAGVQSEHVGMEPLVHSAVLVELEAGDVAAEVVDAVDVPDVPLQPTVRPPRKPPAAEPVPVSRRNDGSEWRSRRSLEAGSLASRVAEAWHELF